MKDLIAALYFYAQQTRVSRYLQTSEYHHATYGLEEDWIAFRSGLTNEQEQKLETLLSRQHEVEHLEDEATFAAGLSIGMDLGHL